MLSWFRSYFQNDAASGADDEEATPTEICETGVNSITVEARLRQVEVEGDDWILIDRNIEGFAGLDESWYVTPPACFTQPGPVHVETSPLEDLLIEHPSMSVYRAAGPVTADKLELPNPLSQQQQQQQQQQQPQQQRPVKRRPAPVTEPVKKPASAVPRAASAATMITTTSPTSRLPLVPRNPHNLANVPRAAPLVQPRSAVDADARSLKPNSGDNSTNNNNNNNNNRPSHHRHRHHHRHHQHHQGGAVAEQAPRRSSKRNLRNARGDENLRIVQIRSAQKILEKRTSQSAKRNCLERCNKAREVSSGKGRRPRRQDRLRLNNSGANNNRKC